jgi:trehalose 6-phosphate phosphatase
LAAIVEDPWGARPLPGVPALLVDLAVSFELVVVVSGRPPAFLAEVLGEPKGVELVGLYGLARALGGTEAATHWADVIDTVVTEATAEAPEGVYVEPKGLTTTLHWRHAPAARAWVEDFVARESAARGLAVHRGRMELELRPPIAVDKGTVIHALAGEHAGRLRAVAAFGDDLGDLPAFAAVGELAAPDGKPLTAVRVAAIDDESPAEVAAQADLTVRGAAGAVALLRTLADVALAHRGDPPSQPAS